jgi:E3 ubiquitin-protein ligase HUWE1
VISHYFSIFHSEKHIKVLQERDNGNMLGSSFDELVRHHPSLKKPVLENTAAIVRRFRDDADDSSWKSEDLDMSRYALQEVVAPSNSAANAGDVTMAPAEAGSSDQPQGSKPEAEAQDSSPTKKDDDFKENMKMQAIDAVGRVSAPGNCDPPGSRR